MKYLLVNPFNPAEGNGINSYYQSVKAVLRGKIETIDFANEENEDPVSFRRSVFNYVNGNFRPNEVIVEAPETRAATLLVPRAFKTHVRLHTPLGVCQKYEGVPVNQARLSEELRVIAQARAVSAPSYGIVREIAEHLDTSNFIVNKNPILKEMPFYPKGEREFDVIFMGRFHRLKGLGYLNAIIQHLPSSYKIALVGTGATKFKLSPDDGRKITTLEHIEGDQRFELLANAKVCIVPSLFENCSMMMLEAVAAGVPVVAWRTGGNDEFPNDLVKTIDFDRVDNFSGAVIDLVCDHAAPQSRFDDVVAKFNEDFAEGVFNVLDRLIGSESKPHLSAFTPSKAYQPRRPAQLASVPEELFSGRKVFGFTISNEHIEEMWAPILHYTGMQYKLVCKRPLGFHSRFRHAFPVDEKSFSQYDWIKDSDRLLREIVLYKPDVLLTHNGTHPMYQHVMERVADLRLPIIYTELGWFPQEGSIYLDRKGVNGASSIAGMDFDALVGRRASSIRRNLNSSKVKNTDIFIPAQLNNDTNIKVFSPRFRSVDEFVSYVVSQVGDDRKILIKPHPLDRDSARFAALAEERITIVEKDVPVSDILENVGHVVALNSTVLLEALRYDVNIYAGGRGILDHKGIAASLVDNDLSDVLTEDLRGTRAERDALISALQERQIDLLDLAGRNLVEDGVLDVGLGPLAEAVLLSRPRWPAQPPVTEAAPSKPKPSSAPSVVSVERYAEVFKRGCQRFHSGDFAKAATDLNRAATLPGSNANTLRCAAEAFVMAGDVETAISLLKRAKRQLPGNKNITRRLRYLRSGRLIRSLSRSCAFQVPKG